MSSISKMIVLLLFSARLFAEPAGFEVINESGTAERIVVKTRVSQVSVVLRAGERLFVRTLSDNSPSLSLALAVEEFEEDESEFQWAVFTIDKTRRYLVSYINQASKILDMKQMEADSDIVILTNELKIEMKSISLE